MFRPDRPRQRRTPDEQVESNPSVLERLRTMPGGKPLLAVLAVLGQLSLYVPKHQEISPKTEPAADQDITTETEAQEFIAGALPHEVDVKVTNDTVVITDTTHPESKNYTEFIFPGELVPADFSVQMKWAGRSYEHGADAATGELTMMEATVQQAVSDQLAPLEHLGVTPNDMIADVLIVSHGLASPEGTTTGNQQAAQQRAQLGFDATVTAYTQHGIAPEKIHGEAIGGGAEGTLDEFVLALEPHGYSLSPAQAIHLIEQIHDGVETDPTLVQAFQDHVAVHRRADMTAVLQMADVVVRVPAVPGAVTPQTIPGLEYYASSSRRRRRPGTPEYVPPLHGPKVAFGNFAQVISSVASAETKLTPAEVFDTIVRVYTGAEQNPVLREAYDKHIADGGDVDSDVIVQLANVVANLSEPLPNIAIAETESGTKIVPEVNQTTAAVAEATAAFDRFAKASAPEGVRRTSREVFDMLVRIYTGVEQDPKLRQAYTETIANITVFSGITMLIKIAEVIGRQTATAEADDETPTEIKQRTETTISTEPTTADEPATGRTIGTSTGPTGPETGTGTGTGTGIKPPPPLPPPLPPPPYVALRPIYAALNIPLPPKPFVQHRQYASGLGPTKGETIGRAPSRQSFKQAARKHHTGKR